ncbi:MAG: DUF1501 domain-containing protein, partial [Akkermansiaceae bacterium]|nr:DUF1501 domain-containing protein [Akkermansiaceae bacterium]
MRILRNIIRQQDQLNRRAFLRGSAHGIGSIALAGLLKEEAQGSGPKVEYKNTIPRAKRVIYLFQSGGPSQIDLFDPKPNLEKNRGKELPDSVRGGQRITTMTSKQKSLPIAPSNYSFHKCGKSGISFSELLPNIGALADDICLIRSMFTEAINHDPAITFFQTGSQLAGRPSIGSWMSYGLGSVNRNLPKYVVLTSRGSSSDAQPLYSRLWSSGFLPTEHSGVKLRNSGDPVYYLSNPPGINSSVRRDILHDLKSLNEERSELIGDPEIDSRISQYEMAFRMQSSVPELVNLSDETQSTLDLYGPDVQRPGTYAANCLLARRLAERGVNFIQLFHMGWDHHFKLSQDLPRQCRDTDRATAGLIIDLKQRGLLDDTLVVWGGEFGRTVYAQAPEKNGGRDHHPRCFTTMLAGGGV